MRTLQATEAARDAPHAELVQLLKTPVLFLTSPAQDVLAGRLAACARPYRFQGIENGDALLLSPEGQRLRAREAPLCPLAILVDSRPSSAEQRLLEWMDALDAPLRPQVIEVGGRGEAEVLAALGRGLAEMVLSGARSIAAGSREVLLLRQQNEELQRQFAALEAFVARQGLQPFTLAFANPPVSDPARPKLLAEASAEGVSQILPVASPGVSAIGIHVEQLPRAAGAALKAELISLEDLRVLDGWSVPCAELAPGWIVLGLERALAGLSRTLQIVVRVTGAEDDLPVLSVGGLQPLENFQVHDAASGRPLLKNSLAVQVWSGLPGIVLPSWASYVPALSHRPSPGGFRELPVAPGLLDLATHANEGEVSFAFAPVLPLPKERALGCHPPASGLTIARIPATCPPRALRVSANAIIANEKSKDIDFALVVAAEIGAARALLEGNRQPAVGEAVSDWTRVSHGQPPPRLSAFIAEPVATWQDIYVATRMSEAGDNSFAWAKICDIGTLVTA